MDITRALGIFDWLMGDEWLPLTEQEVEDEKWEAVMEIERTGILPSLPDRYQQMMLKLWQEDEGSNDL